MMDVVTEVVTWAKWTGCSPIFWCNIIDIFYCTDCGYDYNQQLKDCV